MTTTLLGTHKFQLGEKLIELNMAEKLGVSPGTVSVDNFGIRNDSIGYDMHGNYCPMLGWKRIAFPSCCGVDLVHYLPPNSGLWPMEIMETWFKWAMSIMDKPAIGLIPFTINQDHTISSSTLYGDYDWIASKGKPWGGAIKNINYHDHALIPYVWCRDEETILKAKYVSVAGDKRRGARN